MHDGVAKILFTLILCFSTGRTKAIKKDIVFLVDSSGSIFSRDEKQAVDFIYNVTKWLTIGPDDIQISVVTFNTEIDEKFKLKKFNSSAELLPNLKRLIYNSPHGGTETAEALEFVRKTSFLPSHGGRPDANKTVVLLTDGQSDNSYNTLRQAELLKALNNTEIFTIGIGSAVSTSNDEIGGISSDPDSYYVQQVDSFIYLCNLVPALVPKLENHYVTLTSLLSTDPMSRASSILNCPTPPPTTDWHTFRDHGVYLSSTSQEVTLSRTRTTRATTMLQKMTTTSIGSLANQEVMNNQKGEKDIVFLVDTSGSISNQSEVQAVDFIYNVTKWLTIGPDDIQISVVTFNTEIDEKFKLKKFNSSAELLPNLKRLIYNSPHGSTETAEALEFVRETSFLPSHGGRPDANKTVVLLTDGQSDNPHNTLRQAELLKALNNTEIFTIGIGSAVSTSNDEIRGISSDPDSYYVQQVDSFIYLCNLVPALVPKLDPMSRATSILNCPTPPPTTDWHTSRDHGVYLSSTSQEVTLSRMRTTRATTMLQKMITTSIGSLANQEVMNNQKGEKDIVFLIDSSGSISNQSEVQAVDFIYNVTKWLTIGPDDIQISVVTFNTEIDEKFKLKKFNSSAELLPNLKRLIYNSPHGSTETAEALEFVRKTSFLPSHGGRPDANKTVVLLTDGQSDNPHNTLRQAELLKALNNTEIFTIGIGSAVSTSNDEIRGISSDPDSYYVQQVDSFIYLCNLVPALVPKLDPMSRATAILNCPTPPPTTSIGSLANHVLMKNEDEQDDIPLIVGVVVAGVVVLGAVAGGLILRKSWFKVSPEKAGQSDVPWMKQYNEAPEGQFNTKFNPASL